LRGRIRASRPAFAGWGFGAGDLLGERLRLCVVGSSFAQGVELALRLADSAFKAIRASPSRASWYSGVFSRTRTNSFRASPNRRLAASESPSWSLASTFSGWLSSTRLKRWIASSCRAATPCS
jgi:hypothetical protein